MRGYLIAFEGLDKTGKSSQAVLLQDYIKTLWRQECVIIRFPDRTTEIGKVIDSYLTKTNKNEIEDHVIHLLFSANRWEKKNYIIEKINKGVHIIMDRYGYSGVAYTSAKGYDMEWCMSSDSGLPRPDIIFYLNSNEKKLRERSEFGREVYETTSFQTEVAKSYGILSRKCKELGHNWNVIDSNQDINSVSLSILNGFKKFTENHQPKELKFLW
ncbi:hypothetical protein HZS_7360 [Henneguya salminicola]|nr:hypothetical protein HZS_7360 [Henneguya salminicola]